MLWTTSFRAWIHLRVDDSLHSGVGGTHKEDKLSCCHMLPEADAKPLAKGEACFHLYHWRLYIDVRSHLELIVRVWPELNRRKFYLAHN